MAALQEPETYYLEPTPFVPNSKLPVLIYRACLGDSPTLASVAQQIEPNRWLKGGEWKADPTAHYHSTTHECYGVFAGRSELLLGRSPIDDQDVAGVKVELRKGDVLVLPVRPDQSIMLAQANRTPLHRQEYLTRALETTRMTTSSAASIPR